MTCTASGSGSPRTRAGGVAAITVFSSRRAAGRSCSTNWAGLAATAPLTPGRSPQAARLQVFHAGEDLAQVLGCKRDRRVPDPTLELAQSSPTQPHLPHVIKRGRHNHWPLC